MPQAFHLHLAGVGKGAFIDQLANTAQGLLLAGVGDFVFQLVADVEVIFQRALATPRDDGDFRQAGLERFFDAVLDQRRVDHRQHFLGHRLGRGKKACAVAGRGKQTFLDHGFHTKFTD